MIRLTLAVLAVLAVAGAALILTETGRNWLRAIKAEVTHRIAISQLSGVTRTAGIRVKMPDGVTLATDLYRPDRTAPAPTILMRLPYGKTRFQEVRHWIEVFAPRGYNVVVQDMRGRWGSEGVFAPWPNAGPDGAATLGWIAQQDWSDGQVATIGCSALGESQIALAAMNHPAHSAMVPMGAGGGIGTAGGLHQFFGIFEGGIPALASNFGWFVGAGGKTPDAMGKPPVNYAEGLATLPLRDAVARYRKDPTDFEALLDGFTDPAFWRSQGYAAQEDSLPIPALYLDGWYDQSVNATLALARKSQQSGAPTHVVIGPGNHCDFTGPFRSGSVGDVPINPQAARDVSALAAEFLDHRLKNGPAPDLPAYQVFVLNADRWMSSTSWPPANAMERQIFLEADALSQSPAATPATRSYLSDPANPVPTIGGAICCTGTANLPTGPIDQSPLEARDDMLVYTSPPLDQPLTIAGPLSATLFVSTDAPDADLIARLTDVSPDGRSTLIQEGGLRLRYRDGYAEPALMTPGTITQVTVGMRDIAWKLAAGHRLRLHVASSSFPRLARNMQGGGDPHLEDTPTTAEITIHSGPETPSHVQLFEVPD